MTNSTHSIEEGGGSRGQCQKEWRYSLYKALDLEDVVDGLLGLHQAVVFGSDNELNSGQVNMLERGVFDTLTRVSNFSTSPNAFNAIQRQHWI